MCSRINPVTIFLIGFMLSLQATAQNLVPNASFEYFYKCPDGFTPWNKKNNLLPMWDFPTKGTPDHFHRCCQNPETTGVPVNFKGNIEPKTGDGYVGLFLMANEPSYREYLQVKLYAPLKKGVEYCVCLHYALSQASAYAVDRLGVHFSGYEQYDETDGYLPLRPHLENTTNHFLSNKGEWESFGGVYKATGGERYMLIGNFYPASQTGYQLVRKKDDETADYRKKFGYYYIDDVSVIPKEEGECQCPKLDFDVEVAELYYDRETKGRVRLNIIGGTPPYTIQWSNDSTKEQITYVPAGMYEYRVRDKDNLRKKGKVALGVPDVRELEKQLKGLKESEPIVLEQIYFEFDKAALLEESFVLLDFLASFIKQYKIQLIEISGHTDNMGTPQYNEKLSRDRAQSVVEYLSKKGVDKSHLAFKGYGETKPKATNDTDEGRQKNRRVEFRILKK